MIVDCYTHAWDNLGQLGKCLPPNGGLSRPPGPAHASLSRHLVAAEPVDRTIVIGFKSHYLEAEIPNARIAEFVHDHSDTLIGFAGIDPSRPKDAITDLRRTRDEWLMRGVAVAPAAQDFHPSSSNAMSVYAEAARLNLPVLFHAGPFICPQTRLEFARPFLLDEVARELPNLRIIVAHLGYPWVEETVVLLGKHANVFAEISGLLHRPWLAYQALLSAWQHGVMDKLLFGSGFPASTAAESIETLYGLNHLVHGTHLPVIPREQLRGIVQRDALGLLGIASPSASQPSRPSQEVLDFEHEVA